MSLYAINRQTRQHLVDLICSFLDKSHKIKIPPQNGEYTLGLRVNCLQNTYGCVYLCLLNRSEGGRLTTFKRFRFEKNNWAETPLRLRSHFNVIVSYLRGTFKRDACLLQKRYEEEERNFELVVSFRQLQAIPGCVHWRSVLEFCLTRPPVVGSRLCFEPYI